MQPRDFIVFDAVRRSDSPFVESVWRCHSEASGPFIAVASGHWELVVSRVRGELSVTLHGGETRARDVHCPPEGEWLAIRFRQGAWLQSLPAGELLDGRDVSAPLLSRRRFLLDGCAWEIPSYENAEDFVARLARAGLLTRDAATTAALDGDEQALSLRTTQRHIRRTTGMTRARLRCIERARLAASLLRQGVALQEVVHRAGYFDQAHLTHSLKLLIGLTPAAIARGDRQLSFLYNTAP